jgi:hypothetical protein
MRGECGKNLALVPNQTHSAVSFEFMMFERVKNMRYKFLSVFSLIKCGMAAGGIKP